MSADDSAWQRHDGCTAAVLHEVFSWLDARELARAGGACRAWRHAAAAPCLWRHLLPAPAPAAPGPAATHPAPHTAPVNWRQEVVCCQAGWALEERVCVGGAPVHAALAPDARRLALCGDEPALQLWRCAGGRWQRAGGTLEASGWRGAVRAHWAPAGDRLLVVGALALVDSWELLVLDVDEEGCGPVQARARCGAGAGGCWVDAAGAAFLSLELSVLAPRLACTSVWVNAASQETKSEYTGVRALLFRIFNEDAEHITCADVAQVPLEAGGARLAVLVAARGCRAGGRGALAAWPLRALVPPPLLAAELGDLRARALRHAARSPPPAAEPPPPDEATVRALCEPPHAACSLATPPAGLVFDDSGTRVWVSLSGGGACCVSLPTLRPLLQLPPAPDPGLDSSMLHYIQPSVSHSYFASAVGWRSGAVRLWRAGSGAAARAPRAHPAPAAAALLTPARLLVLAGEHLYVWKSGATLQPSDESLQKEPASKLLL